MFTNSFVTAWSLLPVLSCVDPPVGGGWGGGGELLICLRSLFIAATVTSVIILCGKAASQCSTPRGSVENMYNS